MKFWGIIKSRTFKSNTCYIDSLTRPQSSNSTKKHTISFRIMSYFLIRNVLVEWRCMGIWSHYTTLDKLHLVFFLLAGSVALIGIAACTMLTTTRGRRPGSDRVRTSSTESTHLNSGDTTGTRSWRTSLTASSLIHCLETEMEVFPMAGVNSGSFGQLRRN